MNTNIEVLRELDELVEAARLLGATQAKKLFGCHTDEDRRFERAMYESIDKHRAALLDWEAKQPAPQQPAARPPKPTECMNGCPDRQVCDHCQWPPGPDQQPAACVGCEGKPAPENTPCAVCGRQPAAVDAHELWAAAQLAPGEGIEDGVRRIENILHHTTTQPAAVDEAVCGECRGTGEVCTGTIDGTPELFDCNRCSGTGNSLSQQPADLHAITHCDNCGCDWPDNGLDCLNCKRPAAVEERDALERDAARYRQWRDKMISQDHNFTKAMQDSLPDAVGRVRPPTADEWDAAIDATMQSSSYHQEVPRG